jgi:DNA-directed RNA polymerase specialized sigma24 family protein
MDKSAQWPLEILRLAGALRSQETGFPREAARGDLWRLLFEALMRFLLSHARHSAATERAVLEDIAAEKALELLGRAESGAWDITGRSPSEVAGYVSTAARYGWIDHVQRAGREVQPSESDGYASPHSLRLVDDQIDGAEATEWVHALRDCVDALPDRGRRAWFFRAYYEMSSRDIAQHPLVAINAPHVDVLVQRTREALRKCLQKKGHEVEDAGRRAFVELWEYFDTLARREEAATPLRDALPTRRTRQ